MNRSVRVSHVFTLGLTLAVAVFFVSRILSAG